MRERSRERERQKSGDLEQTIPSDTSVLTLPVGREQ